MPARAHDVKIFWFVYVVKRPASRIERQPGRLVDHGHPKRLKQSPERTLAAKEQCVRGSAGGGDAHEAGERPEPIAVLQRHRVGATPYSHAQHLE